MAQDLDPFKLSSPRIFLVRMTVFLILGALLVVILYKQIWAAFLANPGLNALIICVLLVGILMAYRQVIRLFPEVAWVNSFRLADPGLALARPPTLLAPLASILGERTSGRMAISPTIMRSLLDSIATPLDEARDLSRYLTGLLSFLDLQTSQAQNRFYIDLEDWLSTTVRDLGTEPTARPGGTAQMGEIGVAIEHLKEAIADSGSGRAATAAMASLAEAIHGLVNHMRTEQQMIRDWADAQAHQQREVQRLLERIAREDVHKV